MTKKSAMTMAFGLALALLVGVAAISLTFGGTSVASASRQHKPIVKHQVQTVTVHKQAKAQASSGGVRIVHLSSSAPTSTYQPTSAGSSAAGFENEAGDDGYGSFPSGSDGGNYGDD
jgi:hypothetical protein